MSTLTALDSITHKLYKLKPVTDFSFAKKDNLCSVLLQELSHLLNQTPIVFAKNETGLYELCSLQGLEHNRNYFVSDSGSWKGGYIPARYRSYPFLMAQKKGSKKKILCFYPDSKLVVNTTSSEAIQLFDEDSKPSAHIQKVLQFFNSIDQNQKITSNAVKTIVEAELLEDWIIKVKNESSEQLITGIKKINFTKFHSLTGKALSALKNSGALQAIYGQYFSMKTLEKMSPLVKESHDIGYTSHKDRAIAKKTFEDKKQVDNLVQNLLLDD